jgi:hypothetical protein
MRCHNHNIGAIPAVDNPESPPAELRNDPPRTGQDGLGGIRHGSQGGRNGSFDSRERDALFLHPFFRMGRQPDHGCNA